MNEIKGKWDILKKRLKRVKVWMPLLCLIGTVLIQMQIITIDQAKWDDIVSNLLAVLAGLGILSNPDE